MTKRRTCGRCGMELDDSTTQGYWPRCLLREGLEDGEEDGEQRSEVRDQRSEIRGQRSEVRGQKAENGGRKTGWFEPGKDFDFEVFDSGNLKRELRVNENHLRELFEDGHRRMTLKHAAEQLGEIASVGRSAAYEALKLNGRFGHLLIRDPKTGLIGLRSG